MNQYKIKERLFKACEEDTEKRIKSIQEFLKSIEESRNNETKSSAGDKYETGRSMMQIEEENNRNQLFQAIQVRQELMKIDPMKISKTVETGSLVETNKGNYYISIGVGKIRLDNKVYYCVSNHSPIGMKMLGKETGDEIEFNGAKIKIGKIC